MGKIIRRGLAKPDDPIFSSGTEVSTNHAYSVSPGDSAPLSDADDPNRPETEEDGIEAEKRRRLKVRRQVQAAKERAREKDSTDGSTPSPTSTPRDPEAVKAERDLFSRLGRVKQPPMDSFTDSTERSGSADSPPVDLVDLVAKRHRVSREEAQRMIDESGVY